MAAVLLDHPLAREIEQQPAYQKALAGREYQQLRTALKLVERGKLQPVVDRIFEFEELHQALTYLQEAKQFGKVVLKLAD